MMTVGIENSFTAFFIFTPGEFSYGVAGNRGQIRLSISFAGNRKLYRRILPVNLHRIAHGDNAELVFFSKFPISLFEFFIHDILIGDQFGKSLGYSPT